MQYRILGNKDGKFKVQSKPFLRRWTDRGEMSYVDYGRLNWKGTEFGTLENALECLRKCKEWDEQNARERQWFLVGQTS